MWTNLCWPCRINFIFTFPRHRPRVGIAVVLRLFITMSPSKKIITSQRHHGIIYRISPLPLFLVLLWQPVRLRVKYIDIFRSGLSLPHDVMFWVNTWAYFLSRQFLHSSSSFNRLWRQLQKKISTRSGIFCLSLGADFQPRSRLKITTFFPIPCLFYPIMISEK